MPRAESYVGAMAFSPVISAGRYALFSALRAALFLLLRHTASLCVSVCVSAMALLVLLMQEEMEKCKRGGEVGLKGEERTRLRLITCIGDWNVARERERERSFRDDIVYIRIGV